MQPTLIIILIAVIWNLITHIVTAGDKIKAMRHKWRVPEKVFVIFALLCGGLGVLSAFYIWRHKTRHYLLLTLVWLSTVVSYGLVGFGIYWFLK